MGACRSGENKKGDTVRMYCLKNKHLDELTDFIRGSRKITQSYISHKGSM